MNSETNWPRFTKAPGFRCRAGAALAAAILLAIAGCWTGASWAEFENLKNNTFFQLSGAVMAMACTFAVGRLLWIAHEENCSTKWWDVGRKRNEPTWEEVLQMIMDSSDVEPIQFIPKERSDLIRPTIYLFIAYFLLYCFLTIALSIIINNEILPFLLTDHEKHKNALAYGVGLVLNFSGNLTAFLALIAALVSIYFTYHQLQAKVKADSRQAWIDKLRARVSRFIALADLLHYKYAATPKWRMRKDEKYELQKELDDCRIEMELMLNPSEKDHRLLIYLTLKLALFDDDNGVFEKIDDVKNLKKSITGDEGDEKNEIYKRNKDKWDALIGKTSNAEIDDKESLYSNLVGYTIRLSHILLKREWERVKSAR